MDGTGGRSETGAPDERGWDEAWKLLGGSSAGRSNTGVLDERGVRKRSLQEDCHSAMFALCLFYGDRNETRTQAAHMQRHPRTIAFSDGTDGSLMVI